MHKKRSVAERGSNEAGKLFPAAAPQPLWMQLPKPRSIMDGNTNIFHFTFAPFVSDMSPYNYTNPPHGAKGWWYLRVGNGRRSSHPEAMEFLSRPPPCSAWVGNGNPIPFVGKSVVSVGRMSTLAHLVPNSQPSPRRSGALGAAPQPIAGLIDIVVEESARSHRSHSRAPMCAASSAK